MNMRRRRRGALNPDKKYLFLPDNGATADYLDCGNKVTIGNDYGVDIIGNTVTMGAFVTPSSLGVISYMSIIAKGFGGSLALNHRLCVPGLNSTFQMRTQIGGVTKTITSVSELAEGVKSFVVCRYNGSALHLFFNGIKEVTETLATGNLGIMSEGVKIGTRKTTTERFLGNEDNCFFVEEALSDAKILEIANRGYVLASDFAAGKGGVWDMETLTGGLVTDILNSNHGQLVLGAEIRSY